MSERHHPAQLPRRRDALRLLAALAEPPEDGAPRRRSPAWPAWRSRSSARCSTRRSSNFTWIAIGAGRWARWSASRSRACRSPRCRSGPRSRTPSAASPPGLVGTAKYSIWLGEGELTAFRTGAIVVEVILGFLTFTGSLMAAGKLQEVIPTRPITYRGQNVVNLALLGVAVARGRRRWSCDPTQLAALPGHRRRSRSPSACC